MHKASAAVTPQSGQTEIFDQSFNIGGTRNWGGYKAASGAIETLQISATWGAHGAIVLQAKHKTSISYSIDPGSTFSEGITPVTFTATDLGGNSASCSFNVTVHPSAGPTVTCPDDIVVSTETDGCAGYVDYALTTTDICGSATLTRTAGLPSGYFPPGETITAYTITGPTGLSDNCSFKVTVNDDVAPVAICEDQTIEMEDTDEVSVAPEDIDNHSVDNCGTVIPTLDKTTFDCSNLGPNTVTLTVTDLDNNTATCTATVTIVDDTDPEAYCQNHTAYLDGNGEANVSASDIDNNSSDHCGIASLSLSKTLFDCDDVGDHTVTLTVTDESGNTSACQATVTVAADNIAPEVYCKDHTAQLDADGNATISTSNIDDGSFDACGTVGLSLSQYTFDCDDVGDHTITLTVTDGSSNSNSCQATLTVEDNIAPIASCQNFTIDLENTGDVDIVPGDIDNGSSDNCAGSIISLDKTTFDCDNVGTNTVVLTITDASGNASSCTATVTINDVTAPQANCQNHTVQLDANGEAVISTADIDDASFDHCGITSMSLDNTTYDCGDIGAHTVNMTVTDNNSNSSTCTATVTVTDDTAPSISCTNTTVYLDEDGQYTFTGSDLATSNDNCGTVNYSMSPATVDCWDLFSDKTVTVTANDGNGNSSTCQAIVAVVDDIDPVLICETNATVALGNLGTVSVSGSIFTIDYTDNCSQGFNVTMAPHLFSCEDIGDNTVTVTVSPTTQIYGNPVSCTATLTIIDDIAPTAYCHDITVELDNNGMASITADDIDGAFTPTSAQYSEDNCDLTLALNQSSFDCSDIGTSTVTLTATDGSGNSSSCQATVTVEDNTAPTALCNDVTVYLDGDGNGTLSAAEVNNNSYDNCGVATTAINQIQFSCNDLGTKNVILTVTDVNANSSSCTSNITVEVSGALENGWSSTDIGQVTVGNDYWYDPCDYPPTYYVTGSGNNAVNMLSDNVAFTSYALCGDASITAKIESIDPNGYGGLMIRETTDAGSKQVSVFSNMTNTLRHETRYLANANKVVQSFFKPSPIWLKLQRQGDWIFSYYSFDGSNFQYIHGVYVPMQSCVEIGMASFTYLPNAQTESVFSNVSISDSNGSFGEEDSTIETKPSKLSSTTLNLPSEAAKDEVDLNTLPNKADKRSWDNTARTWPIEGIPLNHYTPTPINLYPNPNQGQFTLQLDKPLKETRLLNIYNSFGQLATSRILPAEQHNVLLDIQGFPQGTYWLEIEGEHQKHKIIVAR
ncbi:MAG: HYR domain-containing protein [Chitinophagales bacterium]|nr:HYR domain-containing protein [Chitinophagales bacterium]